MADCERCGREVVALIMSQFNTDMICLECRADEKDHPMYEHALQAEFDAISRGEYNFPGIGLPRDISERRRS